MTDAGTHDHLLVALSVLVAAATSYTSQGLVGLVSEYAGWALQAWLMAAASAMGSGIWSMHFLAMLAFNMG